MAEEVEIQGSGTAYRVALDLTIRIALSERREGRDQNRGYWLKLYSQSLRVVHGGDPDDAQDDDE